jgi:hypothetical protein
MRQWVLGILSLLFCSFATLGAVVISELHTDTGLQFPPRIPFMWLWLGDATIFASSVILLYFAIRRRKTR